MVSSILASVSPIRWVPIRKKRAAKKGVVPKIRQVDLLRFIMPVSARVKIVVV